MALLTVTFDPYTSDKVVLVTVEFDKFTFVLLTLDIVKSLPVISDKFTFVIEESIVFDNDVNSIGWQINFVNQILKLTNNDVKHFAQLCSTVA